MRGKLFLFTARVRGLNGAVVGLLGVVGSFVGGLIFSLIFGTQPTGLVISFIVALIGAVVLVAIVHMVRREPVRTV